MLDRMPAEVLNLILEEVRDPSTYAALCKTSKELNAAALPYLYRVMDIPVSEVQFQDADLAKLPIHKTKYMLNTTHLGFSSVFVESKRLERRCFHEGFAQALRKFPEWYEAENRATLRYTTDPMEDDIVPKLEFWDRDLVTGLFGTLGDELVKFLSELKDDSLTTFRWNVGACMPSQVLHGYLQWHQNNLQEFSWICNTSCPHEDQLDVKPMPYFEHLRSFSFTGLLEPESANYLEDFFTNHADQLVEVNLDLLNWKLTSDFDILGHFCPELLGGITFPALKKLRLAGLDLFGQEALYADCFNFANLDSLELRHCDSDSVNEMANELKLLAETENGIHLNHLETSFQQLANAAAYRQRWPNDDWEIRSLMSFVGSFHGLKDFALLTWRSDPLLAIRCILSNHHDTIERVVLDTMCEKNYEIRNHHQEQKLQALIRQPRLIFLGIFGDVEEIELLMNHKLTCWTGQPVHNLRCTLYSNGCYPDQPDGLSTDAMDFLPIPALQIRVLHLRRPTKILRRGTGRRLDFDNIWAGRSVGDALDKGLWGVDLKLLKFAEWAFSSEGMPKLEIIAFGDFSWGRKCVEGDVLLCRAAVKDVWVEWTFRRVIKKDWQLHDLIKQHADMLSACPWEPILEQETD